MKTEEKAFAQQIERQTLQYTFRNVVRNSGKDTVINLLDRIAQRLPEHYPLVWRYHSIQASVEIRLYNDADLYVHAVGD